MIDSLEATCRRVVGDFFGIRLRFGGDDGALGATCNVERVYDEGCSDGHRSDHGQAFHERVRVTLSSGIDPIMVKHFIEKLESLCPAAAFVRLDTTS